jgi:hypothetical protein
LIFGREMLFLKNNGEILIEIQLINASLLLRLALIFVKERSYV